MTFKKIVKHGTGAVLFWNSQNPMVVGRVQPPQAFPYFGGVSNTPSDAFGAERIFPCASVGGGGVDLPGQGGRPLPTRLSHSVRRGGGWCFDNSGAETRGEKPDRGENPEGYLLVGRSIRIRYTFTQCRGAGILSQVGGMGDHPQGKKRPGCLGSSFWAPSGHINPSPLLNLPTANLPNHNL